VKRTLYILALIPLGLIGVVTAYALGAVGGTEATVTAAVPDRVITLPGTTNVATYTIPDPSTVTETIHDTTTVTTTVGTTTPTTTTTPPPVTCDTTVSPGASLSSAILNLAAGKTLCLNPGTYSTFTTHAQKIAASTIRSTDPLNPATILGGQTDTSNASNLTFSNLRFVGNARANTVYLGGANIIVQDSEITNNYIGSSCVIIGDHTAGAQTGGGLFRNRIHDCGATGGNQTHCIYSAVFTGGAINGNTIWNCRFFAIQFGPDSHNLVADHNTFDGGSPTQRGGLLYWSEGSTTTTNVEIKNSIIVGASGYPAIGYCWTSCNGSIGSGNTAHDNCLWDNAAGDFQTPAQGYTQTNNPHVDPLFVNRAARNYSLQAGSPCLGKGA
jgi:hypothetical protein